MKSLEDFTGMVGQLHNDEVLSAVYVTEATVVCVLDDDLHRVERFSFHLVASDIWKTVGSMGQWKDQKAFVRLLKIDLAGALPEAFARRSAR